MAQLEGDFIYPDGFGLELGSDAFLPSHVSAAYPNDMLHLRDLNSQSMTDNFWASTLHSFDTSDIVSLAQSTELVSPRHLEQTGEPSKQPKTTVPTPPSTPLPPPKRGRGRPRKDDTAPRPKKKNKASLPSPSTTHASSQEFPAEQSRSRGSDIQDHQYAPLSSLSPENLQHNETGEQLDRRRNRNREAAHKCRTRKQHSTQKLVAAVAAAEAVNDVLRKESNSLRDETLALKNMVLQHSDCNCDYIQVYIRNAASRLAEEGGRPPGQARSPSDCRPAHKHKQLREQDANDDYACG